MKKTIQTAIISGFFWLSANIHFSQKVEKYMQNGQLLQLKGDLQEQLSFLTFAVSLPADLRHTFVRASKLQVGWQVPPRLEQSSESFSSVMDELRNAYEDWASEKDQCDA